jgi:NAD(P)-dependent dehydrogenase (short-subunit alcohol dehydrogenase family)
VVMDVDLHDRVALVTGGTRGVGAGISAALVDAGARVVACARTEPERLPDRVEFRACDVRDADQVIALVAGLVADFGSLDVLVNNAGGSPFRLASDADPEFVRKVIELNLVAPIVVAQAANRVMQGQPGGGSIVMIGSVSGTRPSPGTAAYGAAKAGLANVTTSLAVEWAPRVRVNAVVAGMVETEQAHQHYGDADGIAAIGRTVPLGRLATPREIGQCAAFLASPLASYLTGTTLMAHGGGERPAFLDAANVEVHR